MTNCSLQSHRHKACAQSGCGLHPCSPHSPSRPTRATQSYSRKRLNDSENGTLIYQNGNWFWHHLVFVNTSVYLQTRSVIVTLVAVLAPAVPTTALYAILDECRLLGLLNPPTNISRRLAISLRPSARLELSKTAPLHWFSKNETWIYNCQFSDNLPTVNSIFQTPQRKQTKVLQLLRNRLDLTCILCSVMNTVADSETAWFWQCFA